VTEQGADADREPSSADIVDASEDAPSDPVVSPDQRRRCLVVLGSVAVGAVVLDQLVKWWVVSALQPRLASGEGPVVLFGGLLKFTYVENTGAAFSMGVGYTWVFRIVAVIVAVVILRPSRRLGSVGWSVALGGLLGGLLGNLIDRLTRPPGPGMGSVVDFIAFPNFPVFNVADMCIVGSAILMVLLSLRGIDYRGSSTAS